MRASPANSPSHGESLTERDAVVDRLRADVDALIGTVVALRRRVDALEHADADHALVAALVRAIGPRVVFAARDVIAHAAVDRDLRAAVRGLTTQRLGYRLRALAGQTFDGVTIERIARTEDGIAWTLTIAEHRQSDRCGAPPSGA